ncbi:pentatricopeptide repeat-containing protein [Quercus suber]|uniref:Pentatricopeptide repeat-containing protein n=1 Tax=Quercus suber TaxID=58331 RepID=A0AAW0LJG8_QUESU
MPPSENYSISFAIDAKEFAKKIFLLGESFLINQFVESMFQFKNGLVNYAFGSALRALLLACCELRNINEGRKVHCEIIKVGSPDSFVLTALVDMYAKCGEVGSY